MCDCAHHPMLKSQEVSHIKSVKFFVPRGWCTTAYNLYNYRQEIGLYVFDVHVTQTQKPLHLRIQTDKNPNIHLN